MVKAPSPQGKAPLDDPFAYFAAVVREFLGRAETGLELF